MKISGVKGMNDVLPGEIETWQRIESVAKESFRRFGYQEIRTPILEDTALFVRGVGGETEIVGKEMYTFADKAERSLTLRPEGTAPAARAYIEHSIAAKDPLTRWYYIGPMFRYERMKTGRYRQFWQIGAEAYGAAEPAQDVELIDLLVQMLSTIGLSKIALRINSLGDDTCRPAYLAALKDYFEGHRGELCEDCQTRLIHNPLRILDCKVESCRRIVQGAPSVLTFLCDPCRTHFESVQRSLDRLGIGFQLDPTLVRGLDYYTRTAFELIADDPALGTASAVGGGGRYDRLVQTLGGPPVPAVGFALGLERLALLVSKQGKVEPAPPDLFIAIAEPSAREAGLKLASSLRRQGLAVETDVRETSLKSQMKRADRARARYALVLGSSELQSGQADLKPMRGGQGVRVSLDAVGAMLSAPDVETK